MKREDVIAEIKEYLQENEDVFNDLYERLDSYVDNVIDDNERWYPMEELNDLLEGKDPLEILQVGFYGEDEEYESFNPDRKYFRFDGYAHLHSADSYSYIDNLSEGVIEEFYGYRNRLYDYSELMFRDIDDLFDKLDEVEDEE